MKLRATFCAAATLLATSMGASAYVLLGPVWTSTPVKLDMRLGLSPTTLIDGSPSYNAAALKAMTSWNGYMAKLQFASVPSPGTPREEDGVNSVFFDDRFFGYSFQGALAVTTEWTVGGLREIRTEADVIFNTAYKWDSYRGPQRYSGSIPVYDIYRVALHEFGHALGLDHPDESGQLVSAIMNSIISDTSELQLDDIQGAAAMYGTTDAVPPPDDNTGNDNGNIFNTGKTSVADIDRPRGKKTITSTNPYYFLGVMDRSLFQAAYLTSSRLGKNRLLPVKGASKWRLKLKLKPGRNLITLHVRDHDGILRKAAQRVLIFRPSR